jgi:hypothetical protein
MSKSIRKPLYNLYKSKLKPSMDLGMSNSSVYYSSVIQLRSITANTNNEVMNKTVKLAMSCRGDSRERAFPRSMDKPNLKAMPISKSLRRDFNRDLKTIYPVKSIKIVKNKHNYNRQKS